VIKKLLFTITITVTFLLFFTSTRIIVPTTFPGFEGFGVDVKAANDPLVFVQIHTWWNAPWGTYSNPDPWGYWNFYNVSPDTLYENSPWPRRIISSLKYPIDYNSNISGKFIDLSLEDVKDITNAGSYPYLGIYDTTIENVVRYQIRSAKNAGIDAFAVSVYDLFTDNRMHNGQPVCPAAHTPYQMDGIERFQQYLDIALQENFKIFAAVWVPFKIEGSEFECGSLESWEYAVARVLNETKNHPAYFKIDGAPVVSPHFFDKDGNLWSFQESLNRIYWATGGQNLFWFARGYRDHLLNYTGSDGANPVKAIAVGAVLKWQTFIKNPDYNHQVSEVNYMKNNHPERVVASHIYPGFDDTFRLNHPYYISLGFAPMGMSRTDGSGRNVFKEQLTRSISAGADILFIESWNDYQEQTQIGPSRVVNGEERLDPYYDLRTLANSVGKTFSEPPLPPKSSLDPLPFLELKAGTVNPLLDPGQTAQVTCDYGVIRDCIVPKTGTGHWQSCSYTGYNGTAATFDCTAPSSGGDYTHTCTLFYGGVSIQFCHPQQDPADNYSVTIEITPKPTHTPTATQKPTSTPTDVPVLGDANDDGVVDIDDYTIWLNNYKQSKQGSEYGDFDFSGYVDGLDHVIWLNNFSGSD
jgi:hypothetical protein